MAGHADSFEHGLHHSPHACRTNLCTNAALVDTLGGLQCAVHVSQDD